MKWQNRKKDFIIFELIKSNNSELDGREEDLKKFVGLYKMYTRST